MTREEMEKEMETCGFCIHWHDYHKRCSITGDKKEHDSEPCELYELDNAAACEYVSYQAGGAQ